MNINAFGRFNKLAIVRKIKQRICWLKIFDLPLQNTMSDAYNAAFNLSISTFALTNLSNSTFALSPN